MLPMHRRTVLLLAAAFPFLCPQLAGAAASDPPRITGPLTHENLSVYLIHGVSQPGPVPLTLGEALAKGSVEVRETGSVNQLEIENLGTEEVFVQSGDIVKGGQQDRVLMVSLLLPAKSGKMPIGAFCVEQGRWTKRGIEDVKKFASSEASIPSKELKLAMQAPKPAPAPADPSANARPSLPAQVEASGRVRGDDTSSRQHEVWLNVAKSQERLAAAVGGSVASVQSSSSLQLALENDKLAKVRTAYIDALRPQAEKDGDVIGYVIAINGKLASADIYSSNGLFRKMWPKQLAAGATEALAGKKDGKADATPTTETVAAFLAEGETAKPEERKLTAGIKLETRDSPTAVDLQTSRADGGLLHRNLLRK